MKTLPRLENAPAPLPASPIILSARDIAVTFPQADGATFDAVRDFSLDIAAGEFVGVMGEPGCGKSTAAMALMGLARAPGRISRGSVQFGAKDLLSLSPDELRRVRGAEIALVNQNPRLCLHPLLSIGQQIVNVIRAHQKISARHARAHALAMLRTVGINDPERRLDSYAHELSTGMTQRVVIAMALSCSPRLLIADEPTSGLDVTIQTQFLDNMWNAARATGSAVLLITQNLGIVANYCDRVIVMDRGAVVEDASVRQFLKAPSHEYSRRVLALQRGGEKGVDVGARSTAVAGREPLMTVEGLTKQFKLRGGKSVVHAVDHASFAIRPGECLGLVGESGSGKTTIGRCLLRLEAPTSGRVTFGFEDLTDLSDEAFRPFRARLQIVFQDPLDSMNPRWTVDRIVGEFFEVFGELRGVARDARVEELLRLVGLDPSIRSLKPRELSAGRQQRVAIARALAAKPAFLVLDEPTSALTPETTADILKLLMELSSKLTLTMLFISHDLTTIRYVCHSVAVMYLGQIVEIGDKEKIFETPAHPYTRALLAAHLFPDARVRRVDQVEAKGLRGEIPSPIDLPKGCYLYGRCPVRVERCRETPQELHALDDGRRVRCWRVAAGELPITPSDVISGAASHA